MLFTEIRFLFLFLPIVLTLYFLSPRPLRNFILLLASIVFYTAGEGWHMLIMVASIVFNYAAGLTIDASQTPRLRRTLLVTGCVLNLALLATFKYADFLTGNLNDLLAFAHRPSVPLPHLHLPLGISFFTFHALSYLVDVYRRQVRPMRNFISFSLYITLFPQLIAGPIIRYKTIQDQFAHRRESWEAFEEGAWRFVIGFGKKMLIANTVAVVADKVFDAPAKTILPAAAWLGLVCYTLQIYYDFSGYSDMAIGLGRMFGFIFPENFNYPYIADSITDFWRRWHLSLSSWFRDYLYIPLGGNRVSSARTYFNLAVVFFLCGLWHGASWAFVIWGLFHGAFLILERATGATAPSHPRNPSVLRRTIGQAYVVMAVMIGWVFFRSSDLPHALRFLKVLVFLGHAKNHLPLGSLLDRGLETAVIVGIIGATPVLPWLVDTQRRIGQSIGRTGSAMRIIAQEVWLGLVSLMAMAMMSAIFVMSTALSAAGTYNPFIYFRF